MVAQGLASSVGSASQGVVRPDGVVLDPPVLHQYPGFQQAGEGLHGQQPEGPGKGEAG
jgi:hypothetical protein